MGCVQTEGRNTVTEMNPCLFVSHRGEIKLEWDYMEWKPSSFRKFGLTWAQNCLEAERILPHFVLLQQTLNKVSCLACMKHNLLEFHLRWKERRFSQLLFLVTKKKRVEFIWQVTAMQAAIKVLLNISFLITCCCPLKQRCCGTETELSKWKGGGEGGKERIIFKDTLERSLDNKAKK